MKPPPSRLWSVPALLALHNIEEAASLRGILASGQRALPGVVLRLVGVPSFPQFLVALSVVMLLPVVFFLLLFATRTAAPGRVLLLRPQAILPLLLGALVVHGPGLVTLLIWSGWVVCR